MNSSVYQPSLTFDDDKEKLNMNRRIFEDGSSNSDSMSKLADLIEKDID